MFKTKPLRPAFRETKRYIVYEAESLDENEVFMKDIQRSLVRQLTVMLGVFDAASAGIIPVKYDSQKKRGILRVNHMMVDKVRACFALINTIDKKPIRISSIRVSGILKKAREGCLSEDGPKGVKRS
ncbi:MAG: Rpp14/Pop5 family protein [Nanoarchaeota archaeon]